MNITRSTFLVPLIFIFYVYLTLKIIIPVSISILVTLAFAGFYFGSCMNQCKKTKVDEWLSRCQSSKLNQSLISHRGESSSHVENTISAFREAIERGATAIELDLRLTKDAHIVVCHDSVVDRTTEGSGKLADFTFDSLRKLKTKTKQGRLVDEPIASLSEVCDLCEKTDTLMILDVKDYSNQMIVQLSSMLKTNSKLLGLALVASFNPLVTAAVKSKVPDVLTAITYRPNELQTKPNEFPSAPSSSFYRFALILFDLLIGYCVENVFWLYIGCEFVLFHKSLMCSDVVDKWTGRNIQPIFWVVNQKHEQVMGKHLKCPVIADQISSLTNEQTSE